MSEGSHDWLPDPQFADELDAALDELPDGDPEALAETFLEWLKMNWEIQITDDKYHHFYPRFCLSFSLHGKHKKG